MKTLKGRTTSLFGPTEETGNIYLRYLSSNILLQIMKQQRIVKGLGLKLKTTHLFLCGKIDSILAWESIRLRKQVARNKVGRLRAFKLTQIRCVYIHIVHLHICIFCIFRNILHVHTLHT